MQTSIVMLGSVSALALSAAATSAGIFTLADRNSEVVIDTESQAGMSDWFVNGTDHLFQQWFWLRDAGASSEVSLDALPLLGEFATDTNPFTDGANDTLSALYGDMGALTIETTWTLRGSANGTDRSDVTEQIVITNNGSTPMALQFFQYTDFDLNDTITDESVQILGGNTARQSDGTFIASETVVTPMPFLGEVNIFPVTRDSLNDGLPTTLNGDTGPLGPGDLTWAFQWDITLPAGQSFIISKDKSIVPTPGAAALLTLAGVAGLRRRR